ncbi:hypothetical protein ACFSE1_00125 [Rhizobium helianthi]|uniref:DUF4347 domain-containing protein n=1 Tax=Rhizobium helianthi TaxID=1132695 RepID=A0ABW4LXR0_9HYPH
MLVYLNVAKPGPIAADLLEALQEYYKTSPPVEFHTLDTDEMTPENSKRGEDLVFVTHGNTHKFGGHDAEAFFELLQSKGFQNGSFEKIYLIACQAGAQAQDNSILDNFARSFWDVLRSNYFDVKLYAPRGTVVFNRPSNTFYIKPSPQARHDAPPDRNYNLKEGMLLVMQGSQKPLK